MSQIEKKFIGANQVDETKILLNNNQTLKAENPSNTGTVDIVKVDSAGNVVFPNIVRAPNPVNSTDLANKNYVDTSVANLSDKVRTDYFTLTSTDITNQYVDLAFEAYPDSVEVAISGGTQQYEGSDFSLSVVGGVTRVAFIGNLATGGASPLAAGDELVINYSHTFTLDSTQMSARYVLSQVAAVQVYVPPSLPGQYRCFQKNATASSGADASPSSGFSYANGFPLGAFNYATAGSGSFNISRWDFFIGYNKSYQITGYAGAGKTGQLVLDFFEEGTSFASGLETAYNDMTGVLTISVIRGSSGNTNNAVGESIDPNGGSTTDVSTGYFDVVVSDNPTEIGTIGGYTGEIRTMATEAAPFGTLECDGSELSRTTYSRLFGVIGTSWGQGTPPNQTMTTITTIADVSGGLQSTYFTQYDDLGLVVFWINELGAGVQPTVAGAYRYVPVTTVNPGDADTAVASEVGAVMAADPQFTPTTVVGNQIFVVNTNNGPHQPGSPGTSAFTLAQTQGGTLGTFNIPDLRGYFPRGWDHGAGHDPDAAARVAIQTGGATGDNVGSYQADQNVSHTHSQAAHSHSYVEVTGSKGGGAGTGSYGSTVSTGATTAYNYNDGGNQANPRNVDVMYVVIY
jgi:microcystin-dependent protein